MSFLQNWFNWFLSLFTTPNGKKINTTVIPFASKTTNILDKKFSSLRLLFVSIEGNIKNSDKTTIKYKSHDANTWREKKIYGNSHVQFNDVIDEMQIIPAYGDTRYGKCIITYEGNYWSGKYVGSDDLPNLIIDYLETIEVINLIKEITTIKTIEKIDLIDLISTVTSIEDVVRIANVYGEFILNGGFENNFDYWINSGNVAISTVNPHSGTKCVRISPPALSGYVEQTLPTALAVSDLVKFIIYGSCVGGTPCNYMKTTLFFSDGTTGSYNSSPSSSWTAINLTATIKTDYPTKTIWKIKIQSSTTTHFLDIDSISILGSGAKLNVKSHLYAWDDSTGKWIKVACSSEGYIETKVIA